MISSRGHRRWWRNSLTVIAALVLLVAPISVSAAAADDPLPALTVTSDPNWSAGRAAAVGDVAVIDPGQWNVTPTDFEYQWYRNGLPIDGATAADYTLVDDDQDQYVTFTITAERAGYAPGLYTDNDSNYISGPNTLGTIVVETPPTVVGTPQAGQPLVVTPGKFEPADVQVLYYWRSLTQRVSGTPADASSFTPADADAGFFMGFSYQLTKPLYTPVSSGVIEESHAILPAAFALEYSTITGTPIVGGTLTAVNGWNATPDETDYQWMRDGVPIDDATSSTYSPVADDWQHVLSVLITVHQATLGTDSTTVTASGAVTTPFTTVPTPTITGTPAVAQTLTASPGDWGEPGTTFRYVWAFGSTSDTSDSLGSAQNTIALGGAGEVGERAYVRVIATAPGYGPTSSGWSAPTDPIAADPVTLGTVKLPTVHDNEQVDPVYTVRYPVDYQWSIDGSAVAGATDWDYLPVPADYGHLLTVTITSTDREYLAPPITSNAERVGEGYPDIPIPTITGTGRVGQTLEAQSAPWGPGAVALSYEWVHGVSDAHIASGTSLKITPSEIGEKIRILVTGRQAHFYTLSQRSVHVTIKAGLFTAVTLPAISGTAVVGSTLHASQGAWSPSTDIHHRYQWFEQATPTSVPTAIAHATSSSYRVTSARSGELVSVRVSVTKSYYDEGSAFSALTPAVTLTPVVQENPAQ